MVVFVCEHGSAKSLVAASFFDRLAAERGAAARAVSRGTAPDAAVPGPVVKALGADGFDVAGYTPQALGEADVARATRVVVIGADIGAALTAKAGLRLRRWDDIPPVSGGYEKARDEILARIRALIGELERERRD
jgi:protein-tyrosine-phosphatase